MHSPEIRYLLNNTLNLERNRLVDTYLLELENLKKIILHNINREDIGKDT